MNSPTVSVCLPLFNGAETVAELLRSIRAQTFADFRVTMADDASTDGTLSAVEPFLDDPRFRLIRRQTNVGFYANLTSLLEAEPTSEFLICPGQDDVWLPGLLEKHVNFMNAHPDAGVVHSRCSVIDAQGGVSANNAWYWERLHQSMKGADLIEALLTHNFVCFPAATVRRLAFEEVKRAFYTERFTFVPDWWLWLLISARGWSFGYLPEADCRYRIHPKQLTQTLGFDFTTLEMSRVLPAFAGLLDGERFGRCLSEKRRAMIKHSVNARLLRRGIATVLRGNSKEGWQLIQTACRNDSFAALLFPLFIVRYLIAKATQHPKCSGVPELFHPLGNR